MSSVRVVARIRPLLPSELSRDTIVTAVPSSVAGERPNVVKIPNPRNPAEAFSFHFNSVYDHEATQQDLFDNEVAPTVKHLFNGFDTTIFAYGVTGTGKTHTMRGGKSLAERGVIPRLLSGIYRRGRKVEKDSAGAKQISVSMSYYEIYCDKVYDLFEPPEKRTPAGLPIRDCNGKTVVAGLTEKPCECLKDFEIMYDEANRNRSTGATKLNAHSSRSHAILCVKISQSEGDHTITSTASAIDLAGSEDNRRTENGKERLVESSAINKSLFVLAQCVEAISKKQARIPYRESKMTRILALGQNNGLTLMILNLAPVRSYHLDTLSSLTFANRTKKIEIREVENEPMFMGKPAKPATLVAPPVHRQPLKCLPISANIGVKSTNTNLKDKPTKAFSVYNEKSAVRPSIGRKRPSDEDVSSAKQSKQLRTSGGYSKSSVPSLTSKKEDHISRADLESLVNRMVEEKLAERTLDTAQPVVAPLSIDVQRRLEALEQRVQSHTSAQLDDERTEGLQYLLMAKQHQARGEDASALKMYELALPFFAANKKLESTMRALRERLDGKHTVQAFSASPRPKPKRVDTAPAAMAGAPEPSRRRRRHGSIDESYTAPSPPQHNDDNDNDYKDDHEDETDEYHEDNSFHYKPKAKPARTAKSKSTSLKVFRDHHHDLDSADPPSPRTTELLRIINTCDVQQIKSLKGVGVKKAEGIVNCLLETDAGMGEELVIRDLAMLAAVKGVGLKTVEKMREGIMLGHCFDDEDCVELGSGGGSGMTSLLGRAIEV